jgi:uracil-DNA glycosylase
VSSFDKARASLPACWQAALGAEFDAPYMRALEAFVAAERAAGKSVYPAEDLIFAALARTPLSRAKAVILGQDPYHGPGQAMGLAFSVPHGIRCPPSLRNIFRELKADLGVPAPRHGCLLDWADRGVLLLNATLTVEGGKAGSHARVGWQRFTDRVLQAVSARQAPVAFLLWGNHARSKGPMLDAERHLVHLSEHPSPLAAYRGFFGSRPFSKTNAFLVTRGMEPIDWKIGCDCEG